MWYKNFSYVNYSCNSLIKYLPIVKWLGNYTITHIRKNSIPPYVGLCFRKRAHAVIYRRGCVKFPSRSRKWGSVKSATIQKRAEGLRPWIYGYTKDIGHSTDASKRPVPTFSDFRGGDKGLKRPRNDEGIEIDAERNKRSILRAMASRINPFSKIGKFLSLDH